MVGTVSGESIAEKTKSMKKMDGYINLYWEEFTGKLWMEISDFDKEFLFLYFRKISIDF